MAHGYMGSAETMSVFAKMYHDWGYNVLAPDARGHEKIKEIILGSAGTIVKIMSNGLRKF